MEQGKSLQVIGQGSVPAFVEAQMASLEGAMKYAVALLKSKMCPAHFYEKKKEQDYNGKDKWVPDYENGKPEAVLMVLQHGREIGLSYMQSLQQIVPVNGLVAIKGDGAKSLIMGSGKCESWKESYVGQPFADDYGCEITAKRKDTGEEKTIRFTVAEARRAGLWVTEDMAARTPALKYGGWYKYPNRMVRYRALGFIARDLFPDVLQGTYIEEEAKDIDVDNTVVKIEDGITVNHAKIEKSEEITSAAKKVNKPTKGAPEKVIPIQGRTVEEPVKEENKAPEQQSEGAHPDTLEEKESAPTAEENPITANMNNLKGPELWDRVEKNWPIKEFAPIKLFDEVNVRTPSKIRALLTAMADNTLGKHLMDKYNVDVKAPDSKTASAPETKNEEKAANEPKKEVAPMVLPDFIQEPGENGRSMKEAVALSEFMDGKVSAEKVLELFADNFSEMDSFFFHATIDQIKIALSIQ